MSHCVIIGLFLTAILLAACSKSDFAGDIPECIKHNIEANKAQPNWNVKQVDEFKFQGVRVYIFEPDEIYADMQTGVVNSDCTTICSLGGIAGNTMCNGESFSDKAVFIRTVWHK